MGIENFNQSPKNNFEFLSGSVIENARNLVETLELSDSTQRYFEYVFRHFAVARNKNAERRLSESSVLFRKYVEQERSNGPINDPSHFQLHLFLYLFSGDVQYLMELVKDLYLHQEIEADSEISNYYIDEMLKLVSKNDLPELTLAINFYFNSAEFNLSNIDWFYNTDGYDPIASKMLIEKANSRIKANNIAKLRRTFKQK
jgi:hypothetical protein